MVSLAASSLMGFTKTKAGVPVAVAGSKNNPKQPSDEQVTAIDNIVRFDERHFKSMGYDMSRFSDQDINKELICTICKNVKKNPMQISECQHSFCEQCIKVAFSEVAKCPIDDKPARQEMLAPPPLLLLKLLYQLHISCQYQEYGCERVLPLDEIEEHQLQCDYHPDKGVTCKGVCGLKLLRKNFRTHDCITELKTEIALREDKIHQKNKRIQQLQEEARQKASMLTVISGDMKAVVRRLDAVIAGNSDETFAWKLPLP